MTMRLSGLVVSMLVASACAAPLADARSPAPADPSRLAGSWTLSLEGRPTCALRLTLQTSAHGYEAVPEGACPAPIAQWRSIPDGVELAGADGLTLILLEPSGPNAYAGRDADRRRARMSR